MKQVVLDGDSMQRALLTHQFCDFILKYPDKEFKGNKKQTQVNFRSNIRLLFF